MSEYFENVVAMMRERLGAKAYAVQYPMGQGELFNGIVDIVRMKAIHYEDELGSEFATATAYRTDWAPQILAAVQAAGSFEELLERLRAAGLRTG